MTVPENAIIFDTGPLRHFSQMGWLGVLKFLMKDQQVFIPEIVERELRDAAASGVLAADQALEADWINVHRTTDLGFTVTYAGFEDLLVADGENRGECGVLAMGKIYGCELVIDDATARSIAETNNLKVTGTVSLLCDAVRSRRLTLEMVEDLADDLLESEYFLPFGKGRFRQYVVEQGLLDY